MGVKNKHCAKMNNLFMQFKKLKLFNSIQKILGLKTEITNMEIKDVIKKLYTLDLNNVDVDQILKLNKNMVNVDQLNIIKKEEKERKERKNKLKIK